MPVGTESAHKEGMGATLRIQRLTLRSGTRALRVRKGEMRFDVLVRAAAAVALVACGVAHSADLQPIVSEPCCFQPNEQLHCVLRHCCDRRLQGRPTRLCDLNRTCGVQLVTRPAKFWRESEQPWLEKAIAADIANSSESPEGTYAASCSKGPNSITSFAEPALSKRSQRLPASDLSVSV